MPASNPRIIQKGLILLFVPLLFEVVVAASLMYLQHYYDQSVKAEAHRKQIVFHVNEFWFHSTRFMSSNLGHVFIRNFDIVSDSDIEAFAEHSVLTKLLADDPRQMQQLAEIMAAYNRSRAICTDLQSGFRNAPGHLGQMMALKSNLGTCKRLLAANIESGNLIRSFREYELQQSKRSADQVRSVAVLIQAVLAVAVVGSGMIALLLFGYFMRGIHTGVQTLVGNIKRFKNGETLAPVAVGGDEIALLDARFHEMAEEVAAAQKMKQAFVSTISREFKAPINSTREYLNRLSGGSDEAMSERGRARAKDTEASLDRLITLMNDLLAVQSPGISRMEIKPRHCSLAEVIQSATNEVEGLAEKSDIRIVRRDEPLEVYADPERIVQVLVNLLSNAIKFSPTGSVVEVNTKTVEDQVEVRVVDQGRGVPEELREAIFERFQQVTATDATEKGGTGLGLPICKEIVELHGGRIGVESEEGEGSTFWFRLPGHDNREE